jgi:hypothetical protein
MRHGQNTVVNEAIRFSKSLGISPGTAHYVAAQKFGINVEALRAEIDRRRNQRPVRQFLKREFAERR